jgi:hypothetical protein
MCCHTRGSLTRNTSQPIEDDLPEEEAEEVRITLPLFRHSEEEKRSFAKTGSGLMQSKLISQWRSR